MLAPRKIYGLGLQANVPLAGLRGLERASRVDVSLTMGAIPDDVSQRDAGVAFYVSDEADERGIPAVRATRSRDRAYFTLDFSDGTRIVIDAKAERIWAAGPVGATVEDTATYLLGPALGFALRLRGVTCLHASTAVFGSRCAAFVGPAGAGKSTLAAALARRGHAILTDDVAPLAEAGERFLVQPAYPRIRLWPESVRFLFGGPDALPRITPTWDKRFLDLDGGRFRFATAPLELAAIFFLEPRESRRVPRIEPVAARDALLRLVADSYTARLLDRSARALEFELLGRVANAVPMHRLVASANPAHIDLMCEMLEASVATVAARAQ